MVYCITKFFVILISKQEKKTSKTSLGNNDY